MARLLGGHYSLVTGQSSHSSGRTVTTEARKAPGIGPQLCSGDCVQRSQVAVGCGGQGRCPRGGGLGQSLEGPIG